MTFLSLCCLIIFGRYIVQNQLGKSNNSIQVLNTFLHEQLGLILNTPLKASIESGNLQRYDEQSISLTISVSFQENMPFLNLQMLQRSRRLKYLRYFDTLQELKTFLKIRQY